MTTDLQAALDSRKPAFEKIDLDFKKRGVEFIQTHMPDLNGLLRTKYSPFKVAATGENFNAILYNLAHSDGAPVGEVIFEAPICALENGYPSILAVVDPDSAVIHGWRQNTSSIMLNIFLSNGACCGLDLRAGLKSIEDQAKALGYRAKMAFEIEFGLFHYDEELVQQGRFAELKPYGKNYTNYDMLRAPGYEDLVQEFMNRMASIGSPLASFVTEYGRGMYEFAMKPSSPLAAADGITRAKHHLKELCLERGLLATFMTRFQPLGGESSSGMHVHQCLLDTETGDNLFYDPVGEISTLASHYAAGMLNSMADLHVIYRPTMNSYRRMDRYAWSPQEVFWGVENRIAPIRVINRPNPEACRLEHRCAGSDCNPYLAAMAMLGAGLKGIVDRNEPWELVSGVSVNSQDKYPLHRSLESALKQFKNSDLAAEILGEELWRQYTLSRENELAAYQTWQDQHITDFEYRRYFEGV